MHNNYQRKSGCILFRKIDNEYELLLVKQWNSIFSFPKGSLDPGETSEIAAQRELYEETDIRFTIDQFKHVALLYFQKFYIFDCTDLEINYRIKGEEITEIKWVKLSDLNNTNVNSFLKRFYFLKERFFVQFESLNK